MDTTYQAPNVPLSKFKRTKIIATVGPSTNTYEAILALIKAGANGIRLNFSHGSYEEREQQLKWIRQASKEYSKPVAIILDLQGPKIRLGDFDGIINVRTGQSLAFKYRADYERSGLIPTQYDLSKKMKRGERLYLYDGKVRTIVTSVKDGVVHARAENDGLLVKRKGINLPDTDFSGDVITKKDKADLAFGSTQDFDYVAQSFVQTAHDVRSLRRLIKNLGMSAKIIVKFETKAAIDNMQEIVNESDVIMIARGDLAVEAPAESVPIVQRQLIGLCIKSIKPVIVATQMLFSMTEASEPTRAEVSDVATAVILGADCVMLSDETASGKFPVDAVRVMSRIVTYTETHNPLEVSFSGLPPREVTKQVAISYATIRLAEAIDATVIVAETQDGATALHLAALRPDIPIVAVTSNSRIAQQLVLVYGTMSYIRPKDQEATTKLTNWLLRAKVLSKGETIVTATGKYPGVVGTTDTIKVRVLK